MKTNPEIKIKNNSDVTKVYVGPAGAIVVKPGKERILDAETWHKCGRHPETLADIEAGRITVSGLPEPETTPDPERGEFVPVSAGFDVEDDDA
jgi:hypothetical protein